VSGANGQFNRINTDANGNAVLTYTASNTGGELVYATAAPSGASMDSNIVLLNWVAGRHVTFLTLNLSPQAGIVNQPVTLAASLTDMSANPNAPVSGQSVIFTLGGSTCTAMTNSSGKASCALTPSQAGAGTLSASFAGTSQFVAAKESVGFNTSGPPTAAPTVMISVSPKSVAAGTSAALTWSSTNATACAAAGAWSGGEPTSGTQSVTVAANGSYTYTLTCTGSGGSASASATLTANLAAVTITAKSGGGSFGWQLSLLLGLLAALRLRRLASVRSRGVGLALVLSLSLGAIAGVGQVHADTTAAAAPADSNALLDNLYAGIRVGSMPVHLDPGKLDQGLAAMGYGGVQASTDTSAVGGTVYVGYELNPWAGVEFGYTHRNSDVATIRGAVPSSANILPLVQDTTELIRGYGNIFSLSFRGRWELAPRFTVDPRVGAFFWDTKVTADAADIRVDSTHQGGGVTAGIGAAYRLWRGLELGIGVDYFRGSPNNIATLYGGSLEWRFGGK